MTGFRVRFLHGEGGAYEDMTPGIAKFSSVWYICPCEEHF